MGRALPITSFLVDEARFLARLAGRPRRIGAVAPSGPILARAMAAQIPEGASAILELGPGTGAITEAILARGIMPSRLTAIEYDEEFAALMAKRFPGVKTLQGDAFALASLLAPGELFAAIVSGLPLLNFPVAKRQCFIAQIFERLAPGAPFVQFSYGVNPPVEAPADATVTRAAHVMLNLPPARVWVYRRKSG